MKRMATMLECKKMDILEFHPGGDAPPCHVSVFLGACFPTFLTLLLLYLRSGGLAFGALPEGFQRNRSSLSHGLGEPNEGVDSKKPRDGLLFRKTVRSLGLGRELQTS